ncbi:hypothetical protein FWF48_00510 [Candidatus Saccharibacteria bacterium]|nr:hypothetical protein [Candidatus Saccharibacteria bacterium]
MQIINLSGNRQEVGIKLGELYKQVHRELTPAIDQVTLKKQIALYRKFYPGLLEEINGIARGGALMLKNYCSLA